MNNALPVIRFEIEGFSQSIRHAFALHHKEVGEYISKAIEEYVTPENLNALVEQKVKEEVDACIKNSIHEYFSYGDGRKYISEAVIKKLNKEIGAQ